MKNSTRYFLISFLITFSAVTVLCFLTLISGGESEVGKTQENVPKGYIPAKSHNLNALLIGEGEGRQYALIHLDAEKMTAQIVSLPAEMPLFEKTLSETQTYGGANLLKTELSKFLDVEIQRYIRVDEQVFVKIMDTLGAVKLKTERDIFEFDKGFSLSAGEHILPFEKVVGVIKYDTEGGEVNRLNRQSAVLCEIINQKLTAEKIPSPLDFFNLCVNLISTDISAFDFDTRRDFIAEFLKNGSAEALEIECDESFNLSDETMLVIRENFS